MKKIKYILFPVLAMIVLLSAANPILAAKKRVWGKTVVTAGAKSGGAFSVSARLTGWKQYLNVSFKGVAGTKGVNYELVYSSNGIDQGAGGSVNPSEGNVSRSMFLGTCSHGVCTSHKNISNVRLTVTYQTASGQSVTKRYKVRY